MRGLRASIRSSHEPAGAPKRQALRTIELPPMINSRLFAVALALVWRLKGKLVIPALVIGGGLGGWLLAL